MALPTSAAPRRVKPPFRSAKNPPAEAPSALPKLVDTARVRGTDQRVQGATQARGTGAGWPQSAKHKGRKGGTGSSECCSSSGSKKPPWDGSVFVLHWWHSAIPARSGWDLVLLVFLQTRARKRLEQEQQGAPGTTRPCASDASGEALPMEKLLLHTSGWIISEQSQAPRPPIQLQE